MARSRRENRAPSPSTAPPAPDSAPARASKAVAPSCTATTKAGTPCGAPPMVDGTSCVAHSTRYTDEQRKLWRQRGRRGQQQSARAPFDPADFGTEEGTRRALEHAADSVRAGRMTVSTANAVAKLAGAALRLTEQKLARQMVELQKRVDAALRPKR